MLPRLKSLSLSCTHYVLYNRQAAYSRRSDLCKLHKWAPWHRKLWYLQADPGCKKVGRKRVCKVESWSKEKKKRETYSLELSAMLLKTLSYLIRFFLWWFFVGSDQFVVGHFEWREWQLIEVEENWECTTRTSSCLTLLFSTLSNCCSRNGKVLKILTIGESFWKVSSVELTSEVFQFSTTSSITELSNSKSDSEKDWAYRLPICYSLNPSSRATFLSHWHG